MLTLTYKEIMGKDFCIHAIMNDFSEHAKSFYQKLIHSNAKYPIRSFRPNSDEIALLQNLKLDYQAYLSFCLKFK